MRFLHTADWHIGKTLRGRSRHNEQERVVAEILDIAVRERVDALLLAGDLFDSHAPTPEAERLAYHFFSELAGSGIAAVVIAGNHDHPRRFEALRPLLERFQIHCRPHLAGPADGGVFHVKRARIAALPWLPEHYLLDASLLMGATADAAAKYAERMAAYLDALTAGFTADTVNLVVGHLYVEGAEAAGSERAIHLTRPYAVSAQSLPATASFIALGHLHRPQEITAPSPTFYAGSPLQLDFGEQGQQKRVVLIDAQPGETAKVESIPLTSGRCLRSIRGSLSSLQLQAEEHNNGDWLHVTVELAQFQPGTADRIRELLPAAIEIRVEAPEPPGAPPDAVMGSGRALLQPDELFREYCLRHAGAGDPSGPLLEAFRKLYASHQT